MNVCPACGTRIRRSSKTCAAHRERRVPREMKFHNYVHKTDACWEWTGSLIGGGYGQFHEWPKSLYAHRVSWEMHNGPIPVGLNVCHHCDNRRCVRPDHLFLGTQADNIRDMVAKGRALTGPRNPMWKDGRRVRRREVGLPAKEMTLS